MIASVPTPSAMVPAAVALVAVTVAAFARPRLAGPRRDAFEAPTRRCGSRLASSRARRLRRLVGVLVGVLLVAPFVARSAGPVALVAATAATVLLRRLGPVRAERRRRATIERALPDAMDQLVLSVRAGLTPFQAVCDLAGSDEPEIRIACSEVVRRTERGQPFADALAALAERLGTSAVGLADVIATSDRHGLPLGPMLDQLTHETRATRRRLDQAEARKLPVRLSFPLVVCTLPSFVLLAIAPAVIAALSSLGGTAW